MNRLCTQRSVAGCKHVLLSAHCNNIYNEVKGEMLEYYGADIMSQAEHELYESRTFKIIFNK